MVLALLLWMAVSAQDVVRFTGSNQWFYLADGQQRFVNWVTVELHPDAIRLAPDQPDRRLPADQQRPTIRFADITRVAFDEGAQGTPNLGLADRGLWLTIHTTTQYYVLKFAEPSKLKLFAAEFERRAGKRVEVSR